MPTPDTFYTSEAEAAAAWNRAHPDNSEAVRLLGEAAAELRGTCELAAEAMAGRIETYLSTARRTTRSDGTEEAKG
jgi:hypothetical protein